MHCKASSDKTTCDRFSLRAPISIGNRGNLPQLFADPWRELRRTSPWAKFSLFTWFGTSNVTLLKNEGGTLWEFEYYAKGSMRQLDALSSVTNLYPYLGTGAILNRDREKNLF
jgi:hypothetical protein